MKLSAILSTLIVTLLCSLSGFAQSNPSQLNQEVVATSQLTLEAPPVFVRGFPAILRIKCTGPQWFPATTLFTPAQDLVVDLKSKENGKIYSIQSPLILTGNMQGPSGGIYEGRISPLSSLVAGEQHTMLLDLYSFHKGKDGSKLVDIPNGKYSIQIIFPNLHHKTSPREVNIVAPSSRQQEFLERVRERYLASTHREVEGNSTGLIESWAMFLEQPVSLRDLVNGLSRKERQLMGLHLMLSEIVLYPDLLSKLDEETFKRLSQVEVPSYLKQDKSSLLLELQILRGEAAKIQKQVDALLKKDNGLAWRIDRARTYQSDFLLPQYNVLRLSYRRKNRGHG